MTFLLEKNRLNHFSPIKESPDLFSSSPSLPKIVGIRFNNTGTTHPDNCCAICPENLGVGIRGTGLNGMELQFTITGHRSGTWYDVIRTRRNSLWERVTGRWNRIETQPMGTFDDRHNDDECLRVRRSRIFVIDTPGFNFSLPRSTSTPITGFTGARSNPAATDLVLRLSFAEWVIAKHRAEGIPWKRISEMTFWHSISWLSRDSSSRWQLNRSRSRIARGSLSAAIINSAPT